MHEFIEKSISVKHKAVSGQIDLELNRTQIQPVGALVYGQYRQVASNEASLSNLVELHREHDLESMFQTVSTDGR